MAGGNDPVAGLPAPHLKQLLLLAKIRSPQSGHIQSPSLLPVGNGCIGWVTAPGLGVPHLKQDALLPKTRPLQVGHVQSSERDLVAEENPGFAVPHLKQDSLLPNTSAPQ